MNLIRRLLRHFDRRRGARSRSGYDTEVLFAGWVDLPGLQKEFRIRRP